MGIEIERKFLLCGDAWRADVERTDAYRQGYLVAGPPTTVRARIGGGKARLNIKIGASGVTRTEYEYDIPRADAEDMLDRHCVGSVVEKMRHIVRVEGMRWEIDEFSGDNAGLLVAEIELEDEKQDFARPDWLGEEVSADSRYYNASLTQRPFSGWHNKGRPE